jgi:membrane-associated phospholipid phosphatase
VSGDKRAIRSHAALLVQGGLFVLGILVLATMAIEAHSLAYFPGDVGISHAVQSSSSEWLDEALGNLSWFGFPPQSDILFGLIVSLLFVLGARRAAVTEALAALGSGGLYLLLEHVVGQPRPSPDLVRVVGPIQMTGFPSGHLATFVAVFGFLAFVCYRRLAPSITRFLPIALVAALLAAMGFARIYAGHHWASDVVAGVLLGGLWLAIAIRIDCWNIPRTIATLTEHSRELSQKPEQQTRGLASHIGYYAKRSSPGAAECSLPGPRGTQ